MKQPMATKLDNANYLSETFQTARGYFPALREPPGVFLDNPAGTQVPQQCGAAMAAYLNGATANSGGEYGPSVATDRNTQTAREKIARLVDAGPREIVFGPNMTALAFLLARALAPSMGPGDEIIVTDLDHDANIAPWLALRAERGVSIRTLPIDPLSYSINMEKLERLLNPRTRLLAIGWVSNVTGSIVDVGTAIEKAHRNGTLVFVDATQAVPHVPVRFNEIEADFIGFSMYKVFGPHMGVLVGREEHLRNFHPEGIRYANPLPPNRWEIGTPNFEAHAGTLGTFEYFDRLIELLGLAPEDYPGLFTGIAAYERLLSRKLIESIAGFPEINILGPANPDSTDSRAPTFALYSPVISARTLAHRLIERGFFVRSGFFHANHTLAHYGPGSETQGSLRVGLTHYNTFAEIASFAEALRESIASGGRD